MGGARLFAGRTLTAWGADGLAEDVRVVASELATNAFLHARTPFTLTLVLDDDRLRLTLTDGSATAPRLRRFDSTESTTGRGLRIVAELAQAWGVETDSAGKAVWCEFLVGPASAAPTDGAAQSRPGARAVVEDVEALLAQYGDDDDGTPRPRLSSCSYFRPQLVVRVA